MKQQKVNTQTELSTTVFDWLKATGNAINKDYCKQEITAHADYPALTAVVDFLDAGNMGYQAVQADASYIHEFNYPLLAHIKQPGNEYLHIIESTKSWDEQKETTQHWSGVTIYPEKNTSWKNEENTTAINTAKKQQTIFAAWCGIGILLFAISVYFRTDIGYNIFGLLSLLGVFVSATAFATELGIQSDAVKQVCGAVSKGGCETVLKSKLAKGIAGFTPSDAAVVYFATQFALYITAAYFTSIASILPYLALAGIAVAGVSIYTQAVVIKQWCALCLGIAAILILQAGVAAFIIGTISSTSIILFAAATLFFTAILLPIKTLLKNNIAAKPKLAELKKWQSDSNIFLAQLEKEQKVDTTIWENDLVLGDANAPILITVACNPYCGPCAKAHKQLDDMLEKYKGKIKVQVRLLFRTEDPSNSLTIAAKAILEQSTIIKDNNQLQAMLTDWFELMNLEKWQQKWNTKNELTKQPLLSVQNHSTNIPPLGGGGAAAHSTWIAESGIIATPTFFVNGKKLLGRYDLSAVEKLIPNMAAELAL